MKLHLGCGERYLDGYTHIDIAEFDHYLTAMVVFDEESEAWLNMMAAHEVQETIH